MGVDTRHTELSAICIGKTEIAVALLTRNAVRILAGEESAFRTGQKVRDVAGNRTG